MFIFLLGLFLGIAIGRAYGWMKYHYPESKELIMVKVAKARADRAEQETREIRAKLRGKRYYDEVINDH
jgi:hypothetical protein